MAYGIEILNPSGYLQISDDYPVYVPVLTGTLTGLTSNADGVFSQNISLTSISGLTVENCMIFCRPSSAPTTTTGRLIFTGYGLDPTATSFKVQSHDSGNVEYVVCALAKYATEQSSGAYGLRIWDAGGDLVWSTNLPLFHITTATSASSTGTNGQNLASLGSFSSWTDNIYGLIYPMYKSGQTSSGFFNTHEWGNSGTTQNAACPSIHFYISGGTYYLETIYTWQIEWFNPTTYSSNYTRYYAAGKKGL